VHVVHELFLAHPAPVAVLSNLIEKVGSYAGFAAVIGLAVLCALYFSQARDVKRLREWAGRAPERAAEFELGGRTPEATAVRTGQPVTSGNVGSAQPVSQPTLPGVQPGQAPAAAVAAREGAQPVATPTAAAATANAGSAAAAAAGQSAATPAGAAAGAAPAAAGTAPAHAKAAPAGAGAAAATNRVAPATGSQAAAAAPAATPARPPGASPATGAPTATAAAARAPATGAPTGGGIGTALPGRTGTGAKVLPARPVPQRPRPVINGGGTGLIPPPKQLRDRPWTAPRYLALIVAGVIVLGLGGAVGVVALTGGNKKSSSAGSQGPVELPTAKQKSSARSHRPAAPPIDPSTVTVSVLNATQVTGLASRFGQKVSAAGFRLGNVATASQQQRAESVVLYRPGNSRQARAVARRLGMSQIEPADAQSGTLAGAATVIVVVGADRSRG
jgi:LytR cell envelope-related transcriptional attenuator